ncbi:gamma carbonic anhydrase family protein [Alloiococcus sp. CFN-8]|uniref:gamma carbonic anhydrase family protein n=1 Tax=Alloiococcus sp. CFN-8 TaxID=3416081 RepID=UPI003CF95359
MIKKYNNMNPNISPEAFVAENSTVIGNVTINERASVWYGAVLRGDEEGITIGECSNVQDNAVIHTDKDKPAFVGKNVTIGHGAIIHGCTIEDEVIVGMGAIILNGAHIGKNTIIGAGSLISENKIIPEEVLCYGFPAKVIRTLTLEEIDSIRVSAEEYKEKAILHKGEE